MPIRTFSKAAAASSARSSAVPANTQQTQYQPVNNPGYPPPYAPAYAPRIHTARLPVGWRRRLPSQRLQTAAGVAVGEMVFEGMESLFHGFGGGPYGYGLPSEGGVNNYYDDAQPASTTRDDSSFYNPENDASRQDLSRSKTHRRASPTTATTRTTTSAASAETRRDFADNSGARRRPASDDSGSNFDDMAAMTGSATASRQLLIARPYSQLASCYSLFFAGAFSPSSAITICRSFHASPFCRGSRNRNAG